MWPFFSVKKKQRYVAIFDIGSASVGVALVRIDNDKMAVAPPKIIWADREILSHRGRVNVSVLSRAVFRALRSLSERMVKNAPRAPESAHCFLSSPWHAAQTRIISFSHLKPMKITEEALAHFISRELARFKNESAKTYGISNPDEAEIVEQKAMRILLNGYPTDNPFGTRAKEVDIAIYFSVGSTFLLDDVRTAIRSGGISADVHFHSFTFVFFDVIRDLFAEKNDVLLCDMSGEVTDISLVRDDVLSDTASFPVGKNALFRLVMKETGATIEETRSLFSLVSDNARYLTKKEEHALLSAAQKWKESFFTALEVLSDGAPLPRPLFMIADPTVLFWLGKNIETDTRHYDITPIDIRFLRPLCKVLRAKEDSFLMMEALWITKFLSR